MRSLPARRRSTWRIATAVRVAAALAMAVLGTWALSTRAARADEALEVALDAPPRLTVGDRAEVIARVRAGSGAGEPLLITPSSEGAAVEVVRGRLLRGDADDPAAPELRFRVPVVARAAGTAVVRVRADGFACAERCRAISVEASAAIEVRPR